MVRGFSKVIITGNLTRDPEVRTASNGNSFCLFSVAVNRATKDASGNLQEQVSYVDCVAWSKASEVIAKYAKKGKGILVSGRLQQRSWEDKATGQKRYQLEVVVEDFSFLSSSSDGSAGGYAGGYAGDSNVAGASAPTGDAPAAAGSADAAADAEVIPTEVPAEGEEIELNEVPF